MTTITEMTALLTAVESAPWGEGDGLTGCEIWGRCADPCNDGRHFNWRGAIRHALRHCETLAAARKAVRASRLDCDDDVYLDMFVGG